MNWLYVLICLFAVCVLAAFQNALVWLRRPYDRSRLFYAAGCALVAVYSILELRTYEADSVPEWARRMQLAVLCWEPAGLFMYFFQAELAGLRKRWLERTLVVVFGGMLVWNVLAPMGLLYSGIERLRELRFDSGVSIYLPGGIVPGWGMWVHYGMLGSVWGFGVVAGVVMARRGERSKGVPLAAAAMLASFGNAWDCIVDLGFSDSPYMWDLSFTGFVVVMSVALAQDLAHETETTRLVKEELSRSEERFRSLLEQTTDAVCCAEFGQPVGADAPLAGQVSAIINARLVEANARCFTESRLSPEIAARPLELRDVLPASQVELKSMMERFVRSGYRLLGEEIRHEQADGSLQAMEHHATGIVEQGVLRRIWWSYRDVSERARAERHRRLLVSELDHRVKNNLAAVVALLKASASHTASIQDFIETLTGRVMAMARAHEALSESKWRGVRLAELARLVVGCHAGRVGQVRPDGDEALNIPAAVAGPLSLVLHELGTNSRKHGALAAASGTVDVRWKSQDGMLWIEWMERGGAPPRAIERIKPDGGISLMKGLIEYELQGLIEIGTPRDGLEARIRVPLIEQGATCARADVSFAR